MPESADEVHARFQEAAGESGRMPLPAFAEWPTFPWDVVDGALATKPLPAPAPEEPRWGDVPEKPCGRCAGEHAERVIWENDAWTVSSMPRSGLPLVLMLETKEHLDFPDLSEHAAAEFGRLSHRLVRIIEGLPHIARCHLGRWGDGSAHCHVWLFARTAGLEALRGSFAIEWDDILPPTPEDVWRADLAEVARKLATHGGTARV
jgi:hypothetical protein